MSTGADPRLIRFAKGELSSKEISVLEAELDRRPSLRLALAECARTLASDAATSIHEAVAAPSDGTPRPLVPPASTSRPAITSGPERVVVGPTLGEGGMGTVRQGVQMNLGRSVAVKTLRDDTPSGTHRLLQEARLTARLQHPNIVPVHEIVHGHTGELQVILKEVEGELWANVMHDPALLRARFGVEDALDWNLGVLIAICNALAYAHERGVIHRDVKPSNVMIGNYGEVYLLDWGIAAMWGERTDLELAHVEDAPVAGSFAFMAPEQIEGDPDALGPWTDIYLLGATLYQLVAGRPPHADVVRSVGRARPRERVIAALKDDVPRELAAIVEQAMCVLPEERIATPQVFRGLLEAFRSHRGSLDLVDRAEKSLGAAAKARDEDDDAACDRHLGEAEFGFRAALQAWPDNVRAKAGLAAIAIGRIRAALSDGKIQVARRWLDTLADAPASLREAVDRAGLAEDNARSKATQAVWHRDQTVGVLVRGVLLAVFAPVWFLGWLGLAIWPPATIGPMVGLLIGYLVLGTAVVLASGLGILTNQVNRNNVLGAGLGIAGALAWTLGAERLHLGVSAAQLGILLILTLTTAVVSLTTDPRGLRAAAFGAVCFLVAVALPSVVHQATAASAIGIAAVLLLNNVLLRRQARKKEAA